MKRNEDSLRDLWDNIKHNNIRIIGVPEGKERKKQPEKIYEEITDENFPNMGKEIATQVQEAQRVPYRINPRRNTPRHMVIKLAKIKENEKLFNAAWEKQQITYKGTPIRLTADVSAETLQARRARMSTLTTIIQHSFGSPSHSNQRRKRNKRNANWKRTSKTVTVCR